MNTQLAVSHQSSGGPATVFIAKVQKTVARYRMLSENFIVVAAVSGGPDSVALLHALCELKRRCYPSLTLQVAHLNHCLRGAESDEDESFVRELAAQRGLEFTSTRLDVRALARERRRNLEEVAREERYRFLRQVAAGMQAQRIATGHTRTDQAETVLMRLVRGAGGEGLSAIHPVVDDLIIRPLLEVRREEVLDYCRHIGADYRLDRTNLDPTLTRNRLRHEVLPALSQLNPRAIEALARAAENLRWDENYFDQIVSEVLPACVTARDETSVALAVEPLTRLHHALRHRVIRAAIRQLRGGLHRVGQVHIEAVEELFAPGMSGKRLQLPDGLTVWREFETLTLTCGGPSAETVRGELIDGRVIEAGGFRLSLHRDLTRDEAERIPNAAVLDDEKLPARLKVRSRCPGDGYIPAGHHHSEKLKRLMIEHKIPVTQRRRWPIVVAAVDDEIIWGPQLPVAARYAAGSETRIFAAIIAQPL